jgi:hypothetical protein
MTVLPPRSMMRVDAPLSAMTPPDEPTNCTFPPRTAMASATGCVVDRVDACVGDNQISGLLLLLRSCGDR